MSTMTEHERLAYAARACGMTVSEALVKFGNPKMNNELIEKLRALAIDASKAVWGDAREWAKVSGDDAEGEFIEALSPGFVIGLLNEMERLQAALTQQQEAEPEAYACPAECGCLWRDNKDGTMSLFGHNSESCHVCEPKPLSGLIKLYLHPPKPAAQPVDYVPVVKALLRYAEDKTCRHENTHRGGAIWEICDECGQKWADDRGGKPEWAEPKALEDAYALLASGPAAQPVAGREEVETILYNYLDEELRSFAPEIEWGDYTINLASVVADIVLQAAQPQVPEGYQLVPTTLSDAMLDAFVSYRDGESACNCYSTLLSAAKDAERYRYIRKGNQWVVAATQTGCHIDGEVLDELIDSEMEELQWNLC